MVGYRKSGWRYDSYRHSLAAKGVPTRSSSQHKTKRKREDALMNLWLGDANFRKGNVYLAGKEERKMVTFTPESAKALSARTRLAEANGEESFTFEGNVYVTGYAHYLVEHLKNEGLLR